MAPLIILTMPPNISKLSESSRIITRLKDQTPQKYQKY